MRKKFLSLLVATAMVTMSLAGCSAPNSGTTASEPSDTVASGTTDGAETADTDAGSTETADAETSEGEGKLKVAMMLPGPVNDASFNQSAYEGLVEAESEYPIEIAYSENVEATDMVSTMRSYCDTGCELIILVGFDFSDAMAEVAPQYPDVRFAIINGSGDGDNISGFRYNTPETGFIAGAIAGLLTETGKIGYIAGQQFTHVEDGVNGYIAGAMYANPEITEDDIYTSYLDSWTDTVKGKETALSYIEKDVDFICTNANAVGLGVIATCEENDIYAVGCITDQYSVKPGTVPASAIQDGGAVVKLIIGQQLDGTITPGLHLVGAADGVIRYSDWHDMHGEEVPQEVKDKIEEIYQQIIDGSLLESGILPRSAFDTAE